jgi:hypothetical protein
MDGEISRISPSPEKVMKGLDTTRDVRGLLAALRTAGITAIGRYYSQHMWKVLSAGEAQAIVDAGFDLFVVYEDNADPNSFNAATGRDTATRALNYARNKINQPEGSAIYFAVDYDAGPAAANESIREYFTAINKVFSDAGSPYRVGVYADGTVCACLLDRGLASLAWLSQSVGHSGHREFYASKRWAIAQGMPPCGVKNLDADPDELNPAIPDFGGFRQLNPGAAI